MAGRNAVSRGVWVSLFVASCSSGQEVEAPSELSQRAIYGVDNRYEYSAITDPDVKLWADGTAALFKDADVGCNGATCALTTKQLKVTGFFSPPAPLCSDQRFYGQKTGAFCTSFLIGPDTMMTAGHCIDAVGCDDFQVVFGFNTDGQGQALSSVPASDVYRCTEVLDTIFTEGTSALDKDWAIFRLDREVGPAADLSPRLPLPLRSTGNLPSNAELVAIGHGLGLPLKVADDGMVITNDPELPRFYSTVDTFGGSSGSPVLDIDTGLVEGILVTGYAIGFKQRAGVSPMCYETDPCAEDPEAEDCNGIYAGVMRIRDAVDGAACDDGLLSPRETGVDCGGPCLPCPLGQSCQTAYDCETLHCENTICGAPTCDDGQKNGTETGVDCGGSCGDKCGLLEGCSTTQDCEGHLICNWSSLVCIVTPPAYCSNGVKDHHETDVDCGGEACPACTENKSCNGDADCAYSFMCVGGTCEHASTCSDGLRGSFMVEVDIDSGGLCPASALGERCYQARDCERGLTCLGGTCYATPAGSCSNGSLAGAETDIDCGGGACAPCGALERCVVNADCASGLTCTFGHCRGPVASHCYNNVVDGDETDEDCGGSCPVCHADEACETDADCATPRGLRCVSGTCEIPAGSCSDGIKNSLETAVDCGGGICGLCGQGKMCDAGDCASGLVCASDTLCVPRPAP